MAYSGSGTQADPYIVDNWADFLTVENLRYDTYIKWADKADPSQKVVPEITINPNDTWKAAEVDFNGWTFEKINSELDYVYGAGQAIIRLMPFEEPAIYNWHVKIWDIKHCGISLLRKTANLYNCYFDKFICRPLSSSSAFWQHNKGSTQGVQIFSSCRFYNSVINTYTEECNMIIPDGAYYNSELYVHYKYTGDTATKTKHSAFLYCMANFYNSYVGGVIDVSEGTGSFAITDNEKSGGLWVAGAYYSNSIINIRFVASENCTISAYNDNTTLTPLPTNVKSYFVVDNGNNYDGFDTIPAALRCMQGDIKNTDKLTDDSFPYIHDDSERYSQYVNDRQAEDWTWRQKSNVNNGIPFNPFYFYPITPDPQPAEDVDENPYITVYDMQTPQTGFDNHGLAILCPTSCKINEELNGEYNLTMVHPRDPEGKWQYLLEWNIIKALGQLFVIQKVDEVQNGGSAYVQVYAEHITYTLNDLWIFPPVTIAGYHGQTLIDGIMAQATDMGGDWQTQYNFDITTDMDADESFRDWYDMPDGVTPYEMLLGTNGFISRIGGEMYRDNFTMKINERMYGAQDNAFEMAIGYNLTGITRTVDLTTFCTYFRGYDVSDPETAYQAWFAVSWDPATLPRAYPRNVVRSQNFSYEYPEFAEGQLERDTMTFFNQNCSPLISYVLNVKDLRRNPDYKEFENNYRYKVGDRGKVWDERLKSWIDLEITRTEKDAITGDCTRVVIGTQRSFTRPNGYTPIVPRAIVIPDTHIILEGIPPLYFNSNGDDLFDWTIYGAAGGVGNPINLFTGGLQRMMYNPGTGQPSPANSWISGNEAIPVKPDTEYTFSALRYPEESMGLFTLEYDENMNFISYGYTAKTPENDCRTWTTSSTTKYIRVEVTGASSSYETTDFVDFNINQGSEQLPYVDHNMCIIPVKISDGTNSQTIEFQHYGKLYENDSINLEGTQIAIPTYTGNNTLTVDTDVSPRVKISYLEES